MRHGLLLIGLLCFALSPALAQTGQIHGRVTDAATGEPLPGATIAVLATDQRYGTISNTEGHYTLDLPLGAYTLQFSFIGYTTQRPDPQAINADAPIALDIRLSPTTIALSEMTVTPGRFAIMGNATGGRQTLSQEEIQSIPQFGDDVFRAVTRLPGIAGSDFSARFTIRGGEADEVLVRVDGVELYDPFHLKDIGGGALSIVDIALIEGVDLLTGGFPAEYGDRMSGVFDIRTRTPEPGHTRASLGLSMMNARAYIEGANKTNAWFFSGRRGYLDLVLRVMGEDENFSPKYNDAFAKYTYQLNDQHKLQASLLRSHDDLDFVEDNDDRSNTEYGNTYSWLSLDSALSRKLHARTTLLGGRISDQRDGLTLLDDRRSVDFTVADERQFDFLSLRQDWNFAPAPTHYLKWGFDLRHLDAWYDYRSEQRISERDSAGTVQSHFDTTANALDLARYTLGLYAADRIRLADPVALELGLRYDYAGHTNDQVVSPRLNIVYTPDRNTSLRAGWGHFHQSQGIHQLDIQDGETAFHPAQRAEHRVLGLEHFFANGLHLRVEAYDKKLTSLQPTYRNWLNAIEIFPELQDDRVRLDFDGVRSHGPGHDPLRRRSARSLRPAPHPELRPQLPAFRPLAVQYGLAVSQRLAIYRSHVTPRRDRRRRILLLRPGRRAQCHAIPRLPSPRPAPESRLQNLQGPGPRLSRIDQPLQPRQCTHLRIQFRMHQFDNARLPLPQRPRVLVYAAALDRSQLELGSLNPF